MENRSSQSAVLGIKKIVPRTVMFWHHSFSLSVREAFPLLKPLMSLNEIEIASVFTSESAPFSDEMNLDFSCHQSVFDVGFRKE